MVCITKVTCEGEPSKKTNPRDKEQDNEKDQCKAGNPDRDSRGRDGRSLRSSERPARFRIGWGSANAVPAQSNELRADDPTAVASYSAPVRPHESRRFPSDGGIQTGACELWAGGTEETASLVFLFETIQIRGPRQPSTQPFALISLEVPPAAGT